MSEYFPGVKVAIFLIFLRNHRHTAKTIGKSFAKLNMLRCIKRLTLGVTSTYNSVVL